MHMQVKNKSDTPFSEVRQNGLCQLSKSVHAGEKVFAAQPSQQSSI